MSRFRSHDEMALAIADARLTTYVLASAVREWELHAWRLGDVLLQHGVDGAPHVTAGRILPDRVAFLASDGGSVSLSCNGHVVDAGSIFRWEAGSDVAMQVRRPGSWWLFSATPEAIARATVSLAEGGGGRAPVSTGPVKATPEGVAELRELFGEAEAALGRAGPVGLPVEAARKLFAEWPTPIVASGWEIGHAIQHTARSMQEDYRYAARHPLVEAYDYYRGLQNDQPTYDLTSVLYAVRPERGYFDLSPPGRIAVEGDGTDARFPAGAGSFSGSKARTSLDVAA